MNGCVSDRSIRPTLVHELVAVERSQVQERGLIGLLDRLLIRLRVVANGLLVGLFQRGDSESLILELLISTQQPFLSGTVAEPHWRHVLDPFRVAKDVLVPDRNAGR